MTYYLFTLIDYTFNSAGDEYSIDEPAGFDGFKIQLARDVDWHGVFSSYTIESLDIDGDGFSVLDAAYSQAGIDAEVILRISYSCEGDEFHDIYTARIDFGRSQRICGDNCEWQVVLQPDSCITTLRSRVDQDVDLDSEVSFDGTALETYPYLGMEFDLPSKSIVLQNRAETEEAINATTNGVTLIRIVPPFPDVILEELGDFAPGVTTYFTSGSIDYDVDKYWECETAGTQNHEWRLKCSVYTDSVGATLPVCTVRFRYKQADGTEVQISNTNIARVSLGGNAYRFDIDESYSGIITADIGDRYVLYIDVNLPAAASVVDYDQDVESYLYFYQASTVSPTHCKLYLVHEALSRTVESVTDGCMKVRSNYFGRTDSSPYSTDTDGCGALEAVTNGLMIRQARMQDETRPKFTTSFQSLYNGLKAIHAIGVGMETDPITGEEVITVEPIQDYYSDDIILTVDNNNVVKTIDEGAHIGKINIGYSKWEAEEFNGLDEFLTKREYRTTLKNAGGELNQLSNFIASGYAIEITRRKDITTEDWRFDDDTFIICLRRQDTYGQLMEVEQGNIDNASNILDPDTIYNYRISPIRNLLRWMWYIMASYRQPANESLKFTSGTANVIARGILDDTTCRVEAEIISENDNVDLYSLDTYTPPIWFNERVSFTCPLTYSEYLLINETPNGLIGYICNDSTAYGWISRMEYDLQAGEASFTLIPKRDA